MKRKSYGSVSFVSKTNKYQSVFYDIENSKPIHLGFFDTELEAKNKSNAFSINYYHKRLYLLPKGISIDFPKNKFCFRLPYYRDGKRHLISIYRSDNLQDIEDFRKEYIKNIL